MSVMATQYFKRCLVQGGSRGIGLEYVKQLLARPSVELVVATSRNPTESTTLQQLREEHNDRLMTLSMDLQQPESIANAASELESNLNGVVPFQFLINCSGFLHSAAEDVMPERKLNEVTFEMLTRNFQVNAYGPILTAKHFQQFLKHKEPAILASISARVGSISDNNIGGWYSYRASKAAQNQLAKTLALEWQRTHKNVAVVQLHPGTVATDLSQPFQKNVKNDKLFSTEYSVSKMLHVLDGVSPKETGKFYAWDGNEIPW
eukprot:TRINITY_DN12252_c3_g2_i1.p3 TRINITY_DN12252_c3_g2~~TRINITY_DN12252_c3_g2_i1.p3  ORF type:complete len:262 (+),score=48.84 TRINITY_DN12252_c3_g2_i1:5164-5949(+)